MDPHASSIYTAVLISIVVFASVLLYFAVTLIRQQRRYIQVQRESFKKEIDVLERDRSRIALDLHDELGPMLSLTQAHINEMEAANDLSAQHKEKAFAHLLQVMKRMGQIAVNLTPAALSKKGLAYTLQRHFEELEQVSGLSTKFSYAVSQEIRAEAGIHFFRIIQEISHNTIKHAKAHHLVVQFKEKGDQLYLYCKDDGKGIDQHSIKPEWQGLGMGSIRNRCELLGGQMRCTSKKDQGTEYFFRFPKPQIIRS